MDTQGRRHWRPWWIRPPHHFSSAAGRQNRIPASGGKNSGCKTDRRATRPPIFAACKLLREKTVVGEQAWKDARAKRIHDESSSRRGSKQSEVHVFAVRGKNRRR